MTEVEARAIHQAIANSSVTCNACGDQAELLSLRATGDGRLICSDCDADEDGDSPITGVLIRGETDIEQLRRALVGDAAV